MRLGKNTQQAVLLLFLLTVGCYNLNAQGKTRKSASTVPQISEQMDELLISPSVINDYKFVKVLMSDKYASENRISPLFLSAMNKKLATFGIPLLIDNALVSSKSEVLFCSIGGDYDARAGKQPTDLYFIDSKNKVVMYIPDKKPITAVKDAMKFMKNPEPFIDEYTDRMLQSFGSYQYSYNAPAQSTNSNAATAQNASTQNSANNSTVSSDQPKTPKPASIVSDVDINIPVSGEVDNLKFAVIIGNEDYASKSGNLSPEINVPFAVNDAKIFKEYCITSLGIPADQIRYYENATLGQMKVALNWLSGISKIANGKARIIYYYAGHGIPDESSKSAYLMPVDGVPTDLSSGIKLGDLYQTLGNSNAQAATIFLDACFTGGGRNAGLLAARAVRIAPKEETMNGNLVVFSASSGEETSLPYADKGHGLFTYFLLKELQSSKGNETYRQMADNIKNNVTMKSMVVNNKLQTPQVNTGADVADSWKNWKLK